MRICVFYIFDWISSQRIDPILLSYVNNRTLPLYRLGLSILASQLINIFQISDFLELNLTK
jgi:hypothetical protein